MKIIQAELKKLFSFREIYVALFLCLGVWTLSFYLSELPDTNFTFWKRMDYFIPEMGFWFIAIMIVVGISKLFPYETEVGIEELLKTYKYGKTKLVLSKLSTVLIYCFLVVTLFYLIAAGVYGSFYSLEGYDLSKFEAYFTKATTSDPNPIVNMGLLTQLQYLIYQYVYMVFASFSFGLFVVVVSLLAKRSLWAMAICGGLFAVLELHSKFLISINLGNLFFWIFHYPLFLIYTFGYNGMLSFRYLEQIDLPQICRLVLYIFIPIIILIGLIANIYRRKLRW